MWHTQLSKRELIELCLGGIDPRNMSVRKTSSIFAEDFGLSYDVYWSDDPGKKVALPSLIVTPDGQESDFLAALNASSSAPIPFTAFCRVMPRRTAKAYFQLPLRHVSEEAVSVLAVVSIVEAVLYSEGRLTLKTVSPAACKRTVSFSWARAAATGIPFGSLEELAERWLKVYGLVGQMQETTQIVARTYQSLLGILSTLLSERDDELAFASLSKDGASRFALEMTRAIRSNSQDEVERAWRSMSPLAGIEVSLDQVASQSREERGAYLQSALRQLGSGRVEQSAIPACAFLATQVAPRSLEHLDILRNSGVPEVALWYAFFAALQHPHPMLQMNGWMGLRVLRDMQRVEENFSAPSADIAYEELNVIARLGVESISRKLGHAGEIEVEIVPNVTASFTFHSKSSATRAGRGVEERQLTLEGTDATHRLSPAVKEQIYRALSQIAEAIEDPREEVQLTSPQARTKRPYRKKS